MTPEIIKDLHQVAIRDINSHPDRYKEAPVDADRAWEASGTIDVKKMAGLLNDMLEEQFGAITDPGE